MEIGKGFLSVNEGNVWGKRIGNDGNSRVIRRGNGRGNCAMEDRILGEGCRGQTCDVCEGSIVPLRNEVGLRIDDSLGIVGGTPVRGIGGGCVPRMGVHGAVQI